MPRLSNESHEMFAQAFAVRRSFARAAEAAGSKAENLSSAGMTLYARPEVKARVQELYEKQAKPLQMDAARVMREITRVATIDIRRFYDDETGAQKAVHELDADEAACVRGFDRNGNFQFWDKMVSNTLLAKHFKIVGDEGDGVNALASALADRLNAAKRREAPRAVIYTPEDEERLD